VTAVPTIIVGLAAEARIARPLGWPIAIGGGSYQGAVAAAEQAIRDGAHALVSFGLAGGLDPALRPGTLLLPTEVLTDNRRILTDVSLRARLGSGLAAPLLGAHTIAATAAAKHALFTSTGGAALDLESNAVAQVAHAHNLPFAVLRAICDPAERDLPPAALIALDHHGTIGFARVLGSIIAHPMQLPALLRLASDANAARRALRSSVGRISAAPSATP
jgi:adenosylhomocysteine nucleosidase